jgi:TPR repeat protein
MADHANQEKHVFSLGDPNVTARCPKTGRLYEAGSGALSHEQQTANYVREAAAAGDMPRDGEQCLQSGKFYETGSGCHTKAIQSRRFLNELSPEEKAQCVAAAAALAAVTPSGQA